MRKLRIVGVPVVLVLLCFVMGASGQIAVVTARKDAPRFSLRNDQGALVRLSDYEGRVVLLNFWATLGHGCKTEIPWYMEFQNKYKKKGLTVIGARWTTAGGTS